jgi:protein ImuB
MSRSIAIVFPQWMQQHGQLGEEHAFTQFEHVVRALTDVSPLVEVESIGTVLIAARGPSRYFGGDVAVAQHIHNVCTGVASDSAFGVGVAGSRFAATAAAHIAQSRGTPCVIEESITGEFIDAIPVSSLSRIGGVANDTVDLLQRLGLRVCSAVRAVGEASLIDRFGIEGKRVYALVSGGEVRHFAPGMPPSDFARAVEFESPLTSSAHVVAMSHDVVSELVNAVSGYGQQCVRMLITCETDHAENVSRIWGEPHGFGVAALSQRLLYQLDGWLTDVNAVADAPTSGIVRVRFEPLECREVLSVQPLLWGGSQENIERAARAVVMAMAAGDDVQVSVPRWEGGRDVATVYARVPLSLVDITDMRDAEQRVSVGAGVARDWSGSIPRPSPASVASTPKEIAVCDAQGNSVSVTARHELTTAPAVVSVGGTEYRVLRVAGPWPVEERWWDTRRKRRHVRMQALVRHPRGGTGVFLLGLEHQTWTLLARYD